MSSTLNKLSKLFSTSRKYVIGMIHVKALPGTPCNKHTIEEICKIACKEAEIYKHCKVDGVLVENMHDVPYMAGDPGPEITASMARICTEIRRVVPQMPCGIQILAGANQAALAVAHATGLDFIRAEGFVFSHVADEGLMQACAGPLLRYRRAIGAEHVLVLTDIKKKHCSHSLTADISLADTALAAQFFLTDGIIITGMATGDPPQEAHVREVSESCPHLPILLGSGVTSDNIHCYPSSHGFIVGSYFKHGGHWAGDLDPNSVESFVSALKSAAS